MRTSLLSLTMACLVACDGSASPRAEPEAAVDAAAEGGDDAGAREDGDAGYPYPPFVTNVEPELYPALAPALSGDGNVVAFSVGDLGQTVYAFDRARGRHVCIPSRQADHRVWSAWQPQLTRDGTRVVFQVDLVRDNPALSNMGTWDLTTGTVEPIDIYADTFQGYDIDYDATSIFFVAVEDYAVVRLDLTSGQLTKYADQATRVHMSRDGSTFLVHSVDEAGVSQFELRDAEGAVLTADLSAELERPVMHAALSGNGKVLAFRTHDGLVDGGVPDEDMREYLYDRVSKELTPLPKAHVEASFTPPWTLDHEGRYVTYVSDERDVLIVDRSAGDVERLGTSPTNFTASPQISADGRVVAFYSLEPLTSDAPENDWKLFVHEREKGTEYVPVPQPEDCSGSPMP